MSGAVADRELNASPGSAPLYAKAVLGSVLPGGGGSELPKKAFVLRDLDIDREALAAYDHVCGFTLGDEVPSTYTHVLAFPIAMALMLERDFPFPLMGLVHIANSIEQIRPLDAGESPTFRIWAENLRPHKRGRQFDILATAEVDGEVVWRDCSTYLNRGQGSGEDAPKDPADDIAWAQDGAPTAKWSVPGDMGRRYGDVSGDRNPIHLHPLSAKLFGFPSAIAHGMWTAAHVLASYEGQLGPQYRFDVSFRAPLRLPGKATFHTKVDSDGTKRFVLLARNGKVAHLTGTITQ